jgi:hypothetical protein
MSRGMDISLRPRLSGDWERNRDKLPLNTTARPAGFFTHQRYFPPILRPASFSPLLTRPHQIDTAEKYQLRAQS